MVKAGTALIRQDEPCSTLHLLLDGWAARSHHMEDGNRFIPALITPGEVCNLDALKFERLNYEVTMLTTGTVAALPRQRVLDLHASHSRIASAFWSLALIENAVLTEWAASIGRRAGQERLAHLFCELLVRLTLVGKADGLSFDLPLTQQQIADTIGLTAVHVNRILHTLRSTKLVAVQGRRVTILDWATLSAMCGFQSGYLHLESIDPERIRDLSAVGTQKQQPSHSRLGPLLGANPVK